ncbi:MAG: hypothetical protein AMXMBFR82_25340 [Candidatus Hydrogenedentota bacterium]
MSGLDPRQRSGLLALALACCAVALYARTMAFPFVYFDDDMYVFQNSIVSSGLTGAGVVWAFTTGHLANWHPLTWVSHMIDAQCFGMWAGGHHAVNVLIHGANTAMLFLALRALTGATLRSAFVALLFAVHPVNVESVAWISERKNVLSTFFLLATLMAYVRHVELPGFRRYLVVSVIFLLGLMTKPMLVTLPFVLLLLDYWPLNRYAGRTPMQALRRFGRLAYEKIPLFAVSVVSSMVTYAAQHRGEAMSAMAELPFDARLANAVLAYGAYLKHLLWPAGLAAIYPHSGESYSLVTVFVALGILAAISFAAVALIRRAPYLFVGWFWFAGTLVPVIGLVQIGYQSMADRYLYVPAIGVFTAVVWGIADFCEDRPLRRRIALWTGAACVALLAAVCWRQMTYWRGTVPLFERAIAVTETNAEAHNHLAYYYLTQNEPEKAIPHCEAAQEDRPGLAATYTNWGAALRMMGDAQGAIAKYEEALRLKAGDSVIHTNLGIALLQSGRNDDSRKHLEEAVRIDPRSASAHAYLGAALAAMGMPEDAKAHFERALEIDPEYELARSALDALSTIP